MILINGADGRSAVFKRNGQQRMCPWMEVRKALCGGEVGTLRYSVGR